MASKVIIFGTGEFAQVATYYLDKFSEYKISHYTINQAYLSESNEEFMRKEVLPFEHLSNLFSPKEYLLFAPFNYKKINCIRENIFNAGRRQGFSFATYIDPFSKIHTKDIGENCFILENNTIQPYVKIEDNCILWSGNHIGHHTIIKENCFVASHAVVSGAVIVEKNCFIGVNATIGDNIKISSHNIIGAGSVILKDTKPNSVFRVKSTNVSRVTSDKVRFG